MLIFSLVGDHLYGDVHLSIAGDVFDGVFFCFFCFFPLIEVQLCFITYISYI